MTGRVSTIVGIHGIAQQYKGGNELTAEWLPPLKDGLIAAGCRDAADAVRERWGEDAMTRARLLRPKRRARSNPKP